MALTEMGTNHPASQTGQILRVWRKIRFGAGIGLFLGLVLASPWCLVLVDMMQEHQQTFEYIHAPAWSFLSLLGILHFPSQHDRLAMMIAVAGQWMLLGALMGYLIHAMGRRPARSDDDSVSLWRVIARTTVKTLHVVIIVFVSLLFVAGTFTFYYFASKDWVSVHHRPLLNPFALGLAGFQLTVPPVLLLAFYLILLVQTPFARNSDRIRKAWRYCSNLFFIHGLHAVAFSVWLTFNGNGQGQFGYNAALVIATPIFLYGAVVPPALGCLIRSLSRRPAEEPLVSEEKRFLTHGYR